MKISFSFLFEAYTIFFLTLHFPTAFLQTLFPHLSFLKSIDNPSVKLNKIKTDLSIDRKRLTTSFYSNVIIYFSQNLPRRNTQASNLSLTLSFKDEQFLKYVGIEIPRQKNFRAFLWQVSPFLSLSLKKTLF